MDNTKIPKFKKVYSLRIKQELKNVGIEPILETDNYYIKGYKCWLYEETPAFSKAFSEAIRKGEK